MKKLELFISILVLAFIFIFAQTTKKGYTRIDDFKDFGLVDYLMLIDRDDLRFEKYLPTEIYQGYKKWYIKNKSQYE
jgi:hypothetical protein